MTVKRPLLLAAAIALLLGVGALPTDPLAAQPPADASVAAQGGRGVLGGYEHGRVWGWAQRIGDDTPVHVRVEVDGVPVATLVADRARVDLVDKGLHPTGRAGFAAFIGEVAEGAEVEAFIEETGARLTNAPCVVQGYGPVSSCTEGMSRGALGGYEDGEVWGWAQLIGHETPVTVRIEADGVPVATAIANLPRPDLVTQHLHPTGQAGFRIQIGDLPEGAVLTAIIEETGAPLMPLPRSRRLDPPPHKAHRLVGNMRSP